MNMMKTSKKLGKNDLVLRMNSYVGRISDEADHALRTEADKPVEVLRKNMQEIRKLAREALRLLSDQL